VSAVQRSVVELRRQLDQAYANGVKEIRHEIAKIIDEIAQEKGLTLILPQEQTLYVDDTLRISREVLKRLDDRLPALDLDFETN
jgi:Skp family chaperone for outer membrane proteins